MLRAKGQRKLSELHALLIAAEQQATASLREGRCLLDGGHEAGATRAFVIGIEECGKARILFYASAFVAAAPRRFDWTKMWRDFYSHEAKLNAAILFAKEEELLGARKPEDVVLSLKEARRRAAEFESTKQRATYSGETERSRIATPGLADRELALTLAELLTDLDSRLRARGLAQLSSEQFRDQAVFAHQYANALGLFECITDSEFARAVADLGNGEIVVYRPAPEIKELVDRIDERYAAIKEQIPLTIDALNNSSEWRRFVGQHIRPRAYPDWVVACVVFNLAINVRFRNEIESGEFGRDEALQFREIPGIHVAPPVADFVDPDSFELALDAWSISYCLSHGVLVTTEQLQAGSRARRIAENLFRFLSLDVDHAPILL